MTISDRGQDRGPGTSATTLVEFRISIEFFLSQIFFRRAWKVDVKTNSGNAPQPSALAEIVAYYFSWLRRTVGATHSDFFQMTEEPDPMKESKGKKKAKPPKKNVSQPSLKGLTPRDGPAGRSKPG